MASGLRPRPYLSAFRVFGCASGATGLHIIFMRYRGWFIFGYLSVVLWTLKFGSLRSRGGDDKL